MDNLKPFTDIELAYFHDEFDDFDDRKSCVYGFLIVVDCSTEMYGFWKVYKRNPSGFSYLPSEFGNFSYVTRECFWEYRHIGHSGIMDNDLASLAEILHMIRYGKRKNVQLHSGNPREKV